MIVARDVKNIDGMLLVPSGCELSERQIDILQAWGVAELEVEAGGEMAQAHDPLAQLPPETLARVLQTIRHDIGARLTAELRGRYWKPDEFGPVPAEIFKLLLLRQARRILRPPL